MIVKAMKLIFVTTKLLVFFLPCSSCSQQPVLELYLVFSALLHKLLIGAVLEAVLRTR